AGAQELEYSVKGKVVDAISGRRLESVTVSVTGKHYATVTNADGEFVIKSDAPIGTLKFTLLGYKPEKVSAGGSGDMVVKLRAESLTLEEALVISGNPWNILREAIGKIQDNYPLEPELLDCFYRETIRKRSRYIFISEAVASLYKTGYDRGANADRAALQKSRVLLSQRKGDTLAVKMMGGPTQALLLDAVKNPDVFMNQESLRQYSLKMAPMTYIDGRPQLVIQMIPGGMSDYPLYSGMLYIDRESMAFTRMELSLDMSDEGAATRMVLYKKPAGLRFSPKELNITLGYRSAGGKTRLSYFRSGFRFNCDWKKRLFSTQYTIVNELVVTDVKAKAVPIPKEKMFSSRDCLSNKAAEFSDPGFWQAYNIIEPTESLEHAIGRLKKQ
ncbi:MAG: carboxypeptidase-like regulatory domain-containing protein, partial [Bacteroidales bacterium]|nr:carboxypeptidase-like regulatory domain-containing protein [Bacteroidales bacterium]